MKILVGCEESQAVTLAFRALGHEAYSCDIVPCSGGHPEYHLQCDIFDAITLDLWDMLIAFPPCTDLASSGARWFKEKIADGRQQRAIDFFMKIANSGVPKICIENPVGVMSTMYRKPDQIIQPWMFGHPETKATCLWLKGIPLLQPTINVYDEMRASPPQQKHRIHHMPPGADRARLRSKTYNGVAQAMAGQWGGLAD